jgi:hypothetical protein
MILCVSAIKMELLKRKRLVFGVLSLVVHGMFWNLLPMQQKVSRKERSYSSIKINLVQPANLNGPTISRQIINPSKEKWPSLSKPSLLNQKSLPKSTISRATVPMAPQPTFPNIRPLGMKNENDFDRQTDFHSPAHLETNHEIEKSLSNEKVSPIKYDELCQEWQMPSHLIPSQETSRTYQIQLEKKDQKWNITQFEPNQKLDFVDKKIRLMFAGCLNKDPSWLLEKNVASISFHLKVEFYR